MMSYNSELKLSPLVHLYWFFLQSVLLETFDKMLQVLEFYCVKNIQTLGKLLSPGATSYLVASCIFNVLVVH